MTAKKTKFKLPKHLWALFRRNGKGEKWVFCNMAYKNRWDVDPEFSKLVKIKVKQWE